MLRFLLRPRWLALGGAVVLLVAGCVRLGLWQLHRLEQRSGTSALISENLSREPVPAATVLRVGDPPESGLEWRRVQATGRYQAGGQLLVRNRTLQGRTGSHVLVPLRTTQGVLLLVDRGWVPSAAAANVAAQVPALPSGEVTVTGRIRPGERLRNAGQLGRSDVPQPSVARIDPLLIGQLLGAATYGGYVELVEERPAPATAPQVLPPPDLASRAVGQGANLSYALQWFLFALIAAGGSVVLARRELREGRAAAAAQPDRTPVDNRR